MVPKIWVIIFLLLASSSLTCPMEESFLTLPGGMLCRPFKGASGGTKPQAFVFEGPAFPADWGDPYV